MFGIAVWNDIKLVPIQNRCILPALKGSLENRLMQAVFKQFNRAFKVNALTHAINHRKLVR